MAVCYLRSNGMLHGSFCDWFVTVSWFNHMHHADSLVGGSPEWRFSKSICWSPSLPCHFFSHTVWFGAAFNPWNWLDPARGINLGCWSFQRSRIIEVGVLWRSDWFDQISQLAEHLTKDSGIYGFIGSYSGLSFCHQSCYKYLVVIFTEIST